MVSSQNLRLRLRVLGFRVSAILGMERFWDGCSFPK